MRANIICLVLNSRSCRVKGQLVLMREWTVTPLVNRKGAFQCYQHIDTTYKAGKKQTRKTCTKQL